MDTKSPFASKTLWGAVFVLIAFISSQFFGVEITPDEQASGVAGVTEMIEKGIGVVGWFLVVAGRFTATKKVTLTGS
jgi:hypothetical protein